MAGAHFFITGLSTCVYTNRGAQPGRSLADITYDLVMTRKLKLIRSRLQSAGLTTAIQWSGVRAYLPHHHANDSQIDAYDATFVDDTVLLLSPPTPNDVINFITKAAQITVASFHAFAGEVNFKKRQNRGSYNGQGGGR